ncbi:unnamed protein product [Lepeophtheirus salmonis]|uniref:(salmon louse) hypothetical protein n=1 Tax=Lepeophtheirus salmonis TaxID=72036 RepID=A0A7R8H4S5_LEPSM|nr:unnamed protein product [Lepeophtheirus salmonis]CAF2850956.1 unnamed protein product [Lepeophtheirus salmonis]
MNPRPCTIYRSWGHFLQILGFTMGMIFAKILLTVSEIPDLNLLGRSAIRELRISVEYVINGPKAFNAVFENLKNDFKLEKQSKALCANFSKLWRTELGCLKDFALEVKFKEHVKPVLCKTARVPLALKTDLERAYGEEIETLPSVMNTGLLLLQLENFLYQEKRRRLFGNISVSINPQLQEHRHALPLPEDYRKTNWEEDIDFQRSILQKPTIK